jgi:phosphatidyl-myo-inositol alpha-mannosyltransferase
MPPRLEMDDPARGTVVFVSMARGIGGPARSLLTVLANLDSAIDRVLFAPHGDLANRALAAGTISAHLPMPYESRFRQLSRVKAAVLLARYVHRNRRRVLAVHANGQSELNISSLAMLAARVPVVMWAHASRANPSADILRWLWRRRGGRVTWLAVSETARSTLADTLGLDPSMISVVVNPIDPDDVVTERRFSGSVTVTYLGLAAPHKGFDLLADIVRFVDRRDVGFDLFVAPPDPRLPLEFRPPWEALHALTSTHDVLFRGRVLDVRQAYREADIVLCPSREESFGRIAAEAMMNGIPVVASDIPAFRELIGETGAGLLFPVGDPVAAADAIRRLADDEALRQRLGERGREHVQRYLPAGVVRRLEAAYRPRGHRQLGRRFLEAGAGSAAVNGARGSPR